MSSNSVTLLEIGGSHDECLLSQMHVLKSNGYEVRLITTQAVMDRNPVFSEYVSDVFIVDMSGGKSERKQQIDRIWKKLKTEKTRKLVINTAQGNLIRKLVWKALFQKIEIIGIIHTTRKFQGSFTQKMINLKIKKYLLLSEYLLSTVKVPNGISLEYFYPIRFASKPQPMKTESKSVIIIGGVEERRKDLKGFLRMAEQVRNENVRFTFLGKSANDKPEVQSFLKSIQELGLEEQVKTFDSFVPQEVFDQTIQNADLILPIVHPETPSADQYFRNQISGAMSVSFGYKIPMLIHEAYQHIEEMQAASFYYSPENWTDVLQTALTNAEDRKHEMEENPRYNVDLQEKRYLDFVG